MLELEGCADVALMFFNAEQPILPTVVRLTVPQEAVCRTNLVRIATQLLPEFRSNTVQPSAAGDWLGSWPCQQSVRQN